MPRPRKWRKVCCLPDTDKFGPIDENVHNDKVIYLTVDEYETMRLIDLERYTQEECAKQMDVARSTVQSIYNEARRKVTDSIVNGTVLIIGGGNYKICDGIGCGRGRGCRKRMRMEKLAAEMEKRNEDSDTDK
jgi:predicted DNA-binding protein (UPF0251 family)